MIKRSAVYKLLNVKPDNLEAILMLADIYERTGDNKKAIDWYGKVCNIVNRSDVKAEIEKRIEELTKIELNKPYYL